MSSKLNRVVAVVRSYNDPSIGSFCRTLIETVGAVVVVTPTNLEPPYLTARALDPVMQYHDGVRHVKTLMKDGNSWSAMLNVGLAYVQAMNAERKCHLKFQRLLNLSNTTAFSAAHLSAMWAEMENGLFGVVGTTFAGQLADGTPELLGRAYDHPRNTGMMINLAVFHEHPLLAGFDPRWDGAGGMEDHDFVGKMEALTPWYSKMLNLQVPLRVGRHRDQGEYVKLMEGGLAAVDTYHKEQGWR